MNNFKAPICEICGKEQNIAFETTVIMCEDNPSGEIKKSTMYSCQHIIDKIKESEEKFKKMWPDIKKLYEIGILK